MAESSLVFRLLGVDAGASRAIAGVGKAAEAASLQSASAAKRSEAAWAKVGKAFNAMGKLSAAIVVGVAYEGVKAAASFELAMSKVHSQAGAPIGDIKALSQAVLDLSPKVGVGPTELADALYHVESAGFRAKGEVMGMVEAAAKLSQIGGADIGQSTQAMIGVMASGIKGVKDAMDAAALLNTTVGIGDMKMPQLVKAIGTDILPTARAVGLSFEDIAAALATIGDNATPVDQVATRLKTSLLTLINPTPKQGNAFREIGMSSLQLANDFRQPNGLLVGVEDLKKHLNATYPAAQTAKLSLDQIKAASASYYNDLVTHGTNVKDATKLTAKYTQSITDGGSAAVLAASALGRALGGSKTAGIFLTLIAETDRLKTKYDELGSASSRAAKFQDAWATQQATYKQKVADLKAAWDVFLVKVGNAIIPALKDIVTYLSKHPGIIKDVAVAVGVMAAAWTAWKIGSLITNIGKLGAALLGLGRTTATVAAETTGARGIGGIEGAATRSRVGIAGIGTAITRLGTVAAAAGVADIIYQWVTAAGKAKKQISQIMSQDVHGLNDTSGTAKAMADETALLNAAYKHNTGSLVQQVGGLFTGSTQTNAELIKQLPGVIAAQFSASVQAGQIADKLAAKYKITTQAVMALATAAKINLAIPYDSGNFVNAAGKIESKADGVAAAFTKVYGAQLLALPVNARTVLALSATADAASKAGKQVDILSSYTNTLLNHQIQGLTATDAYHRALNDLGGSLDTSSHDLTGNSDAAITNRTAIIGLVQQAAIAASAVAKSTGKTGDYTKALQYAIPEIEAAAMAQGYSKSQIDGIIKSLGLLPPSKSVPIALPGLGAATAQAAALLSYLQALSRAPFQAQVDIQVQTYGSASPAAIAAATQGGSHGAQSAAGTFSTPPGMRWVGERGPELIRPPVGSQIINNSRSMAMAGGGGSITVNINAGSVDAQWLRSGGAKLIAIEVNRATGHGLKLN
jgi:TP901 family phage tail tape measure protein